MDSAPSNTEISDPRRARPSLLHHPVLLPLVLLLLFSIAVIGFLLMRRPTVFRASGANERELLRTVPITSAAGDAISPVFSPDGREIAFVWDGSDRKGYDLYVQLIGADLPLRLTYEKRGLVGPPAWSPDGTQIAFERCDGKRDGIFAVPALGGSERKLTSVDCPVYHAPLVRSPGLPAEAKCSWLKSLQVPRGHSTWSESLPLTTGEKRYLSNSRSQQERGQRRRLCSLS